MQTEPLGSLCRHLSQSPRLVLGFSWLTFGWLSSGIEGAFYESGSKTVIPKKVRTYFHWNATASVKNWPQHNAKHDKATRPSSVAPKRFFRLRFLRFSHIFFFLRLLENFPSVLYPTWHQKQWKNKSANISMSFTRKGAAPMILSEYIASK